MVKSVVSVDLPVGEQLRINKMRWSPESGKGAGRIAIVTGIHGDELEGQYVCFEVQRRIREHPEMLAGTVDIYPALNPLGIDSLTRGIPGFDLDMNRIFPGGYDGTMTEYIAAKLMDDLSGAALCVDIHASNVFLRELPQVRVSRETSGALLGYAERMNVDFVWIHSASTVLESTLAHSLNSRGTPTLVVEMGVGMRISPDYGRQLTDGLFAVMRDLGIWRGEAARPRKPIISSDGQVGFVNAAAAGLFIPSVAHTMTVEKGDKIGEILDPLNGTCVQAVVAPVGGLVFTLRAYPVVDEGSLIARILEHRP